MTSETRWLSAQEEHLWRGWNRLNSEFLVRLQRQMQADAQLSGSDYEVLVHLTDSPEGRVRVSDLATLLQWVAVWRATFRLAEGTSHCSRGESDPVATGLFVLFLWAGLVAAFLIAPSVLRGWLFA